MIWTSFNARFSKRRLLPGAIAALVVAGGFKLGLFNALEQAGYRLLFHLRGELPVDRQVTVIEIDDRSLAELGRFPWSRQQYVRLLDLLAQPEAQVQPSIVAFDLIFSEPSPVDPEFAEAMARHGYVVLASAWDGKGNPLPPVPLLRNQAIATGHILTQPDEDGIVRSIQPLIKGQPTLGLATVQAHSLVQAKVPLPGLDRPLWLNWLGPSQQVSRYSFVDVVSGKVSPQVFQNKIVLVGMTAAGFDPLTTPFDRAAPTSSIYLHATLVQNLLHQNLLHPLSPGWLLLLLTAPLCSLILAEQSLIRQIAGTGGLCLGWGVLSLLLLRLNYLPPVIAPVALFGLTGCITLIYDRTHKTKQLQEQVQRLQAKGVYKEEFLRTATHELRSPIANMQTVIELLKIPIGTDNFQEYFQILEVECQREMELVNDLLSLQRLEAGVDPAQLKTLYWHDWLQEVITPFLARAEAKQQTLKVSISSNLKTATLEEACLRRLISELLNNACKYSPVGAEIGVVAQLQISHTAVVQPSPTPEVVLQVHNTGTEILPEDQTQIFEPFYRAAAAAAGKEEGTGLGLSIVKKLAERLGGEIQVNSRLQNTTFTLRLPLCQTQLEQERR